MMSSSYSSCSIGILGGVAWGAASEGNDPSRRRKPLTSSAARVSALRPFAVEGGCGLAGPVPLPTDATSDTTPELPGLAGFGGAPASTEPVATASPLVPPPTIKGDDGPPPLVTAPSFALTDTGPKPRCTGWVSNPEPAKGSPPIDEKADAAGEGSGVAMPLLDTFSLRGTVFRACDRATGGSSALAASPEPFDGGSGCLRDDPPPFAVEPGDGEEGGGTEPPPADEPAPTDPTLATAVVVLEPAPPALAADPLPAAAPPPPPAKAPAPATAAPPTARAALPTTAAVATRSPPVKAGAPPITAANSFGICQQHIMKMRDPPITSKAVITGRADAEITCASLSQPLLKPSPAEIRQYSRTILMPIETARPMYRSVYGAVHRLPPKPRKMKPTDTTR